LQYKGDVFNGPFCTCLILPWRHCKRVHFSLQKCRKIRHFNVDFWKIFWGLSPYWGGATAPLPRPHPLGAPALRASAPRSGPSVPPSTPLLPTQWKNRSRAAEHISNNFRLSIFRRVLSYQRYHKEVTAVFFLISVRAILDAVTNLAWQAKLQRLKARNFHMSCVNDGRLWLVVAAGPLRRRRVGLNTTADDDEEQSFYYSAKLGYFQVFNMNIFQIIFALDLDEFDRMIKRL